MGMIGQPPEMADVIGLPTYVVDEVVRTDIGGVASIVNCRTVNGILVPQCEVIICAKNIVRISQAANLFAMQMWQRQQMALMTEVIGKRH